MVDYGNFYYFIFIILGIIITINCVFFLNTKSIKFKNWFIFGLLMASFILHFVKIFFEYYQSYYPESISDLTFENICAVSTILFPFFFLSKKKFLMDYMVVMGIFSGIAAIVIPIDVVGFYHFSFEALRFYFDHFVIFLAPFLMVSTGVYQFNYHRIFKVPFMFYIVLMIILVNEVILYATGLYDGDLESMLYVDGYNPALIFGPVSDIGPLKSPLMLFVPKVFTQIPVGPHAGQTRYWPIIWLIIPTYIYISLFGFAIGLLFDRKHIKDDFKKLNLIFKRSQ